MEFQHRMPLLPDDVEMVSQHLAVGHREGGLTFFNASGPICTCRDADASAVRFAAAVLTNPELGLATPSEIARVLGRHRNRVHEYRKRYREGGAAALDGKRRGPRGPSKFKGTRLARAQTYLNEGTSNRTVAALVGVSEFTIRTALKDQRLVRPDRQHEAAPETETAPSTPRQRSDVDATCVGGVAVKRDVDRALAQVGKLVEARPRFEPAESVANAGVLVALPALLGQGLVEVGQHVYGALKNGYFGLASMLLSFGVMALLRIKSIEGRSTHSPGEFGCVLGLDRAPEMKTARRKLAELAGCGRALEFARAISERWAEEAPDALGYLYIDGHVRPYPGRTLVLPKTHVPRRRLCMPATTDYWVNDANAEPLLFVTAPANAGLLTMMDTDLIPEIRRLAGDDRRVTLIFDREGWSPTRLRKWHTAGFDVITYRKGTYRDWQRRCFKEVTVDVSGRPVTYLLAERMVRVARGFRMREVRRLCDTGHQTSVMTTRRDLALETVARRMFSRWQQENFFRYMRHEFAPDHLPTTAVEPANAEHSVPNPAVKKQKQALSKAKARVTKAEQRYGQQAYDTPEQQRRTVRGFKISRAEVGQEIRRLRQTCARLEFEITALPAGVPVREVMDGAPVIRLKRERKIITDTVKMVACRAETQLANLVGPLLPDRNDEARKFMRQVFALPADLLPDYVKRTLVVRLHSMANPRSNRALRALYEMLNDFHVCYPKTNLRLVLEAPAPR